MNAIAPGTPPLVDRFGRVVDYVRLSVTDRCDFRCVYCMAEDMEFLPRREILSLEEILGAAEAFVALGVGKIRLTGGEPLVRQNILWLVERIAKLPGLRELTLTTNGSRLAKMAAPLRDAVRIGQRDQDACALNVRTLLRAGACQSSNPRDRAGRGRRSTSTRTSSPSAETPRSTSPARPSGSRSPGWSRTRSGPRSTA